MNTFKNIEGANLLSDELVNINGGEITTETSIGYDIGHALTTGLMAVGNAISNGIDKVKSWF